VSQPAASSRGRTSLRQVSASFMVVAPSARRAGPAPAAPCRFPVHPPSAGTVVRARRASRGRHSTRPQPPTVGAPSAFWRVFRLAGQDLVAFATVRQSGLPPRSPSGSQPALRSDITPFITLFPRPYRFSATGALRGKPGSFSAETGLLTTHPAVGYWRRGRRGLRQSGRGRYAPCGAVGAQKRG
jgi:hypothetical protein